MAAELEGLRIPFFCIRPKLVAERSETRDSDGEGEAGQEKHLSLDQLKGLKRKIVELLEDMCKD